MNLTDLDPQWIMSDGRRVGFTFISPTNPQRRQSCFCDPPQVSEQVDLFDAQLGDHAMVQPCNPAARWQIAGGIELADFGTISVTPSLDGSRGGLWHGFITGGKIIGGLNAS